MSMKYLICLLLLITACAPKAKEDSSVALSTRDKMTWSSTSPWLATDINPLPTGAIDFDWVLAYDQICRSHAAFSSGGNITISASIQTSTIKGSDIACSSYDGAWTFAYDTSGNLVLCQNTPSVMACITFE